MFLRLALYLTILTIGGLIGYKKGIKKEIANKIDTIQGICLLFLLFIMGVRMGLDDKVISSFLKLGYQAAILAVFSIIFSVIFVRSISKFVSRNSEQEGVSDEL